MMSGTGLFFLPEGAILGARWDSRGYGTVGVG